MKRHRVTAVEISFSGDCHTSHAVEKELEPVLSVDVEEPLSTKEAVENNNLSYCLSTLLSRDAPHLAFTYTVTVHLLSNTLSQLHGLQSEPPSGSSRWWSSMEPGLHSKNGSHISNCEAGS